MNSACKWPGGESWPTGCRRLARPVRSESQKNLGRYPAFRTFPFPARCRRGQKGQGVELGPRSQGWGCSGVGACLCRWNRLLFRSSWVEGGCQETQGGHRRSSIASCDEVAIQELVSSWRRGGGSYWQCVCPYRVLRHECCSM